MGKKPKRTGHCYHHAFLWLAGEGLKHPAAKLVHGIVAGQGPLFGKRIGHAWIEDGEMVIDTSTGKARPFPRVLYYAIGEIVETKSYTYQEALESAEQSGTSGPWWPRIFEVEKEQGIG